MILSPNRLIAAIDTADATIAAKLIQAVTPHCGHIKLGLEYYLKHGPAGFAAYHGPPVFLDLKLHDIPNTVAGAVSALLALDVAMLTIHAAGGTRMIEAACKQAATKGESRPAILAVTVLTSFDEVGLAATGITDGITRQVLRLGELALNAGADGLVCSAHEVAKLRAAFGDKPILVVPGIRPLGSHEDDQARVMTPQQAMQAGASYIVTGRPITQSANPGETAAAIAAAILPSRVAEISTVA